MKHVCEKVSRLASEQLERQLTLSERLKMSLHLMMCSACLHYSRNLKKLSETLKLKRNDEEKSLYATTTLPVEKRQHISSVLSKMENAVD
ncbi:MAG: hypothetical protein AUK35_00510 [Zetaproteobacteria bacterium CG2_30_46_52]|nr:MAG: hypothetical protein AUK35_00510 [Zetaproteobacteria bacterium CG2_30_46_52]